MPTFDELHAFLAREYKLERFEGRNGTTWGDDYSARITHSHLRELEQHGVAFISRHEHATGRGAKFNAALALV